MASPQPAITRRALLTAAAALPMAGCTRDGPPRTQQSAAPAATSSAAVAPSVTAENVRHEDLIELERRFNARLGVYALATGTGATVAHRADERFAFCSTFKALAAAAVLDRHPLSYLDKVVRYTESDLMRSTTDFTQQHVSTGMTIRQACDAAIRHSDGTAGNLLLRELGGPAQLTRYLRDIGDTVTRMDRTEPAITEATPGDQRDTTSPRAIGTDYQKLVLGDALPPGKRAILRDLLERNTTGGRRIRAGVPRGWTVADKTGTGSYGTLNDVAVVWPPNSAPLVIALMSSRTAENAKRDEALLARAARQVVATLTR